MEKINKKYLLVKNGDDDSFNMIDTHTKEKVGDFWPSHGAWSLSLINGEQRIGGYDHVKKDMKALLRGNNIQQCATDMTEYQMIYMNNISGDDYTA